MPYACPINGKGTSLNISSTPSRISTPTLKVKDESMDDIIAQHRTPTQDANSTRPLASPVPHPGKQTFLLFNDEDEPPEESPLQITPKHSVKRPASQPQHVSPLQRSIQQRSPVQRSQSRGKHGYNAGGISKLSLNSSEILKFPKESTHAYSYAHLSPNSLAVRLSILKRSLEILIDRPDLMNDKNERHSGLAHSSPLNLDIARFISEIQNETADEIPPDTQMAAGINIRSNASSAALAALFNASSSGVSQPTDKIMNMGLEALISILQEDKLSNDTSPTMLAKNLHDLSLSTAESKAVDPEFQLRTQLLHALATPFYEPIVQTPIISLNKGASSLALSSLGEAGRTPTKNDRVFHNVSQRNTSPQAVFTCELDDPWNLKAANDLACLIFGVSRTSLRRLTLLDLIAADARDFVLNRLIANSITNKDIIFAGEVVAIAKRGNKVTWASLWAKKKGNLIICMFDQVPCDSVDLVFSVDSHRLESSRPISGNFFNHLFHYKTVDDLVEKFSRATDKAKNQDSSIPLAILEAQVVNDQRYFTVKKNGFNIPCAITSKVLDENEGRVKLRIHSMPYIAGVFIVSASTHKILSLNDSIGKNLFGYDEKELTNEAVDKVIPNFTNILTFVRMNMPALKIVPGLVLPEHFFRQINAITENKGEDGFLTSFGIDGCHKDGSIIKIDVQLRCSDGNTLVLWVTHSRTVYGSRLRTKVGFEDISADSDNEKNVVVTPSRSENGDSEMEHPSQLSIFNENEVQSISRSSSLRSSPVQSSTASTTEHSEVDINGVAPSTPDNDGTDLTKYKVLDQKLDELTLLKIENDAIERTKNNSKHYPRVIGSKRREKSIKEFDVIKNMGQGAYGRVILAKNKEDPNYKVVIKLIIKERILVDTWVRDRKLGTIPSEIQIMSTLNNNPHPNIMRLIDFFEDDDYYYIELPPHGFPTPAIDLFDLIELKKNMTEFECKSIIKQCISAINHLHNNGVVHRDIKDENLIIDTNGVIKLIDFGSAAYIKQGPFDVFVGTLDYAAPEVLNGQSYEGKPQDVWSLGILLYTLVYKENPFYNVDEIMEGELRIPFVTSEGCLALIKRILQRDIRKRPTMQEIVQDEWLNN